MISAHEQGRLWGAASRDFAEVCEPFSRPLYEATLAALLPLGGLRLLDVGCGSGLALHLATGHGARVTGLDAAQAMIDVARERLPDATLLVGDVQYLPFVDAAFDVVTAFNSIQYADDPAATVAELARVLRPGGRIAIGVWADPSRCETEELFQRVRALAPPPPGTHAPLAVSADGVLEELLAGALLTQTASGEVSCPFTYPDLATGWRGQSSIGPFRRAIDVVGEQVVHDTFVDVLSRYRQPDGSYRQNNVFRYVVARRPAAGTS